MLSFEQLATGFGPIIVGTFAIVFSKQINEGSIKFYGIKGTRPKPYVENRFLFLGIALIIIGFGRIVSLLIS